MVSNQFDDSSCPVTPSFVQRDDLPIGELLAYLHSKAKPVSPLTFEVGTLLPDGRLDLCKQNLGPGSACTIAGALYDNPNVHHLLLGTNGLGLNGAPALTALCAAVRASDSIETLYLGCNMIEADGLKKLLPALAPDSNLQALWLKRNPIGIEGAALLCAAIQNGSRLRVLDLVDTHIGSEGLNLLVSAICESKCCQIEHLYLGGNNFGERDAECIARLLTKKELPLKGLYLSVNHLGDEGTAILGESLKHNRDLQCLSLASNYIGASGLKVLCRGLSGHNQLKWLDLGCQPSTNILRSRRNFFADYGARYIAELLREESTLEFLDLSHCGITDQGAMELLHALRKNEYMRELRLSRPVSAHCKNLIREQCSLNIARCGTIHTREFTTAIKSVYR